MIKIGIICPSEIALRRFLPTLMQVKDFFFSGVAYAGLDEWEGINEQILEDEREKATNIIKKYGGRLYDSYTKMIRDPYIDAIYIPLPPALHYYWAKKSLLSGKHVLVEKPATTQLEDTKRLIDIARSKNLVIHENYMFSFHKQLETLDNIIKENQLGDIRLYRLAFGFPRRSPNDFRYNKELGGGALLDCGGYTLKYASKLLGKTSRVVFANSNYIDEFQVDIAGSAVLINDDNITAQIAFGMDNSYRCDIDIWGSKASLFTGRIFTAPAGYLPKAIITDKDGKKIISLPEDNSFEKSINWFKKSIFNDSIRMDNYSKIINQARLVNEFLLKSSNNND